MQSTVGCCMKNGLVRARNRCSYSQALTLIWGPPGSGKTTVIAAFVLSALSAGLGGLWLVAQSNVAVKNIAEKLAKAGFFQWRLLVSTDFHGGWYDLLL